MLKALKSRVFGLIIARTAREEGQALVEYSLILALVSIVSIAALELLGGNIAGSLEELAGKV
ncbi:MAG: Flp family type IVb pilin [Actinobacteria bacterium]|nr:MAG: Flp family type IVb pilin [Actinomycetota bacterium]